jgi:ADP-heptose:LPS heptosyltransferase
MTSDRIAFLKLCCPGDLLFTTPAVRAVKRHFPQSQLFYATGNYSSFIAKHNPNVNQTIIVDPPFELRGRLRSLRAMVAGARTLARYRFDLVVNFHRSPALATMARLAGVKNVLGFDSSKPPATISVPFDSDQHEVKRYLRIVSAIGAAPDGENMEYDPTSKEREEARALFQALGIREPFVVVAAGGGENPGTIMHTKRWPASKYAQVVQYLRKSMGLQTVATGSLSDFPVAESIGADVNIAGRITFPLLAAVVERAALFIGNDSGPLYLASAVRTKTIGIYGPSSPDLVAPPGPNHTSIINQVICHPCYHPDRLTRGKISCPSGTWACMLTVGVEQVIKEIERSLLSQEYNPSLRDKIL